MGSKLKASGIFSGLIFLAAAVINFIMDLASDRQTLISALTDFTYVLSPLLISGAMFASAYVQRLVWLQPMLFLALLPIPIMANPESFYGLGFFAMGVLLLFKLDFYKKHGVPKTMLCMAYIIGLELASALISKKDIYTGMMAVLFILAFIAFLLLTFRDRIFVYLKEPKVKLSLQSKGLADAERYYIRAVVSGKSAKEVGFEFGVSESTVRNTLSRAYKKLGVTNKSDLGTLSEKFEIVE